MRNFIIICGCPNTGEQVGATRKTRLLHVMNRMKLNKRIKRIIFIGVWVTIAGAVTILSIAAIRVKREKTCKGFVIYVNGSRENERFIDKSNIVEILTQKGTETLKGRVTREFDLQEMETRLEKHQWVRDAELFFDNNQVLLVKISERVPIARVITASGHSFYIDSASTRLPLTQKSPARVPVFTNFPSDKRVLKPADQLLIKDIRSVSTYLSKQPFWMAQVSQVDITSDRKFEIIPTIGSHVIEFGDGTDCEKKFDRLYIFYKQVLSKTGMERYARLNIQYEHQVIGVRSHFLTRSDSIRHLKNIEYLIAASQKVDSTLKTGEGKDTSDAGSRLAKR